MAINPLALNIQSKKLGLLIRDARLAKGKSLQECAQALGVSEETFQAYECGEKAPSLPELEGLAYRLDIPIAHFWTNQLLAAGDNRSKVNLVQLTALRQRVIGVLLRQRRLQAGFTINAVAEQANLTESQIEDYERGAAIPLPVLEGLCKLLNCSLDAFQDQHGLVGAWLAQQREQQTFNDLGPEMRAFISDANNLPYLEAAKYMSEIPVESLRSIAESLLSAVQHAADVKR